MCVCRRPIIHKREEHISKVTNHEFKELIESCVQPRPEGRPYLQEIIKKLEACFDNQPKKQGTALSRQGEEITQPLTDVTTYTSQESPDWNISLNKVQLTDKILGRGGWGIVVEGKYCGCAVAVKKIHELLFSDHNRRLFEQEINIALRCRHPCLLQFIGATSDEGFPLIVTELMESSLRTLLLSLSETENSIIFQDVASALSYLHQKKPSPIIHRNISSANVLLWRQGDQWRGKLTVSIATSFQQQTMTIAPGDMLYSAPETLTPAQTVKVGDNLFTVL